MLPRSKDASAEETENSRIRRHRKMRAVDLFCTDSSGNTSRVAQRVQTAEIAFYYNIHLMSMDLRALFH
jgi:hypothetical protein